MNRTAQLQGLRLMRFESILAGWQARQLSQAEAAELGMSERRFRRRRARHEDAGLQALCDRRLDTAWSRRVPADEIDRVLTLHRARHSGPPVRIFIICSCHTVGPMSSTCCAGRSSGISHYC